MFVKWSQTRDTVTLVVDVLELGAAAVECSERGAFSLRGTSQGAEVGLDLDLFGFVQACSHVTKPREVVVTLQKEGAVWWDRLQKSTAKDQRVKPDWDRWVDPDESDAATATARREALDRDLQEQLRLGHDPSKVFEGPSTAYLLCFNSGMFLSWLWVLCRLLVDLYVFGPYKGLQAAHYRVGEYVVWLQLAACLELVHVLLRLVRGSVSTALAQLVGRNVVLFLCVVGVEEAQEDPMVGVMYAAWALAEVIRYPFYGLSLIDSCPPFVTWLRYTAFILLYPIGVAGEVGACLAALPYVRERDLYSMHMPNAHNIAFDFAAVLPPYMALAYLGGLPYLYTHMLGQRRRRLAPSGGRGKAKTA